MIADDELTRQADALHRAFIAFLKHQHPTAPTAVVLSAATYLVGGMAGELMRQHGIRAEHVDDVLAPVVETLREQMLAHLRGLPTRQ